MSDFGALIPQGGVLGAAMALVGMLWKTNRDDRAEYRQTLTDERARHAKEAEEWAKEERHLRERLANAETVIMGERDRRHAAERQTEDYRLRLQRAQQGLPTGPPDLPPYQYPGHTPPGSTGAYGP